jgi:subtilisin-like proprotein convertase family protein
VLGLVLSTLLVMATGSPAQAAGPYTFAGANVGAIPDGGGDCPNFPGAARDVTFNVTGVPQRQLTDVRITGLSLTHTFVGDLVVTLFAPNGKSQVIFGRTGATTLSGPGDTSDLEGPYTFADTGPAPPGNWWTAAAAVDASTKIPSGTYRTSQTGGNGSVGSVTNLTPGFSTVTNPNGTWILRFVDNCASDPGTVSAATLSLTPVAPNCTTQQTNAAAAQADLDQAEAAVAAAVATSTAAKKALAKATKKLKKAKAKVKAATKALASAQDAGSAQAVATAQHQLTKAKKKAKAAKKRKKAAAQSAASAAGALAEARSVAATARAARDQAAAALQTCQDN